MNRFVLALVALGSLALAGCQTVAGLQLSQTSRPAGSRSPPAPVRSSARPNMTPRSLRPPSSSRATAARCGPPPWGPASSRLRSTRRFLKLACEMGLEGIIAKRRSAPYRSGRGGDWLKVKCVQTESFAIIGYEPSAAAIGGIGRLLLAAKQGKGLAYVGGVGTGFTHTSGLALKRQLDAMSVDKPPAMMKNRKGVGWTRPDLVAEIAFRAWTDDSKLRHASYKGLRDAADEASIYKLV